MFRRSPSGEENSSDHENLIWQETEIPEDVQEKRLDAQTEHQGMFSLHLQDREGVLKQTMHDFFSLFWSNFTQVSCLRVLKWLIFFLFKELSDVSDAVSLMRHLSDAHAQIGAEAARLSKFNRRRVITQRELHTAAKKLLTAEI